MSVRIDIPEFGQVIAENAAQEDTLRALVNAVNAGNNRQLRMDSGIVSSLRDQAQAAASASGAMANVANNARSGAAATKSLSQTFQDAVRQNSYGISDTNSQLANFRKALQLTALNIGLHFATEYKKISMDPIATGAKLFNTAIDMSTRSIVAIGTSLSQILLPALRKFPVAAIAMSKFGGFAAKNLMLLGDTLKVANDVMSQELRNSVDSIAEFNRIGGSFAGGMLEMRNTAALSGVTLESYTKVIRQSRDSITNMGTTVTQAAQKIASVMNFQASDIGKSGKAVREELLALGYSYEDQGALIAEYMSMQRAGMSLDQFRMLSDKEIAQGTRKYAEDLKVLADITGKNAKAAMEEARMRSLEADIMSQLSSPEEVKKFQQIYAAMPESAKKGFLEYVATGGQFIADATTNIMMAQNQRIPELFQFGFNAIKNSAITASEAQDQTAKMARRAGQAQIQLEKEQFGVITLANRITGQFGSLAQMSTDFITAGLMDPDAAEKSRLAAEQQSLATDEVTTAIQNMTKRTNDLAVQFQSLTTNQLPAYTKTLDTFITFSTGVVSELVKLGSNIGNAINVVSNIPKISRSENVIDPTQLSNDIGQSAYRGIRDGMRDSLSNLGRYADGGIAQGPSTGFLSILHGTEAVIPLKDKKIPVQFKNAEPSSLPELKNNKLPTELAKFGNDLIDRVKTISTQIEIPKPAITIEDNKLPTELAKFGNDLIDRVKGITTPLEVTAPAVSPEQEKLVQAIATLRLEQAKEQPKIVVPTAQELATAVKTALQSTLNEPNSLVESMVILKTQMESDNGKQASMLQQQISNLENLLLVMKENVDYSRRIANDLI